MNPPWLRCAISDREATSPDYRERLLKQAARLSAERIDLLQLREKDLHAAELADLARALLKTLSGTPTRLLINGRPDVAVAVRAHGVHLASSEHELTAVQVHQLYRSASLAAPVVTVSCHTMSEVFRQRPYAGLLAAILFGPVFEKSVAGQRIAEGSGLDLLRDACAAAAPTPVLALGGVTTSNTAMCLAAGAQGVAGIRLFQ